MGKGGLERSVWRGVDAINTEYANEGSHLMLPEDGEKRPELWKAQCERFEIEFRQMPPKQVWRGQIGALGGCIIGMESIGDLDYWCDRKKKFALLLMAIASARRLFTWWGISHGCVSTPPAPTPPPTPTPPDLTAPPARPAPRPLAC
jgi:hypothetical protein